MKKKYIDNFELEAIIARRNASYLWKICGESAERWAKNVGLRKNVKTKSTNAN